MEFQWLLVLCGLVVIPVGDANEQGHVGSGLIGTDLVASRCCGIGRSEPGGILFGPY